MLIVDVKFPRVSLSDGETCLPSVELQRALQTTETRYRTVIRSLSETSPKLLLLTRSLESCDLWKLTAYRRNLRE